MKKSDQITRKQGNYLWIRRFSERHPFITFLLYFVALFLGWIGGIFTDIVTDIGSHVIKTRVEESTRPHLVCNIKELTCIGESPHIKTVVPIEAENKGASSGTFLVTLEPYETDKIIEVTCKEHLIQKIPSENKNIRKLRISNLKPNKPIVLRVELEGRYKYHRENKNVFKNLHSEEERQ